MNRLEELKKNYHKEITKEEIEMLDLLLYKATQSIFGKAFMKYSNEYQKEKIEEGFWNFVRVFEDYKYYNE